MNCPICKLEKATAGKYIACAECMNENTAKVYLKEINQEEDSRGISEEFAQFTTGSYAIITTTEWTDVQPKQVKKFQRDTPEEVTELIKDFLTCFPYWNKKVTVEWVRA